MADWCLLFCVRALWNLQLPWNCLLMQHVSLTSLRTSPIHNLSSFHPQLPIPTHHTTCESLSMSNCNWTYCLSFLLPLTPLLLSSPSLVPSLSSCPPFSLPLSFPLPLLPSPPLLPSSPSLPLSLSAPLRLHVQLAFLWHLLLASLSRATLPPQIPRRTRLQLPATSHLLRIQRSQQLVGGQKTWQVSRLPDLWSYGIT